MTTRLTLALLLLLAAAGPALAVNPDERLADPVLEARARALSKELRCLVCQNESIDDSNADLAHDLRVLVRERLTAGDTNAQVLAYLQARYGNFVLLKPPVDPATWVLWFGPAVALAIGAAVVIQRRRAQPAPPAPLTSEERARVDLLLADDK
ncbi:cytochrome c-type biogenesis protein CcmH [Aliidongia dinghuensis]|uniref:Cytochrome c-type biogenesis protein n=1 Tax=Aliidongia dinghuensis TaxID=1867774 RepID=A0A8J3E580_9PROT|nr:cytochrome c-type biogenesis protein [Aliidongia dinghuensis]GGF33430.1 cytochrome c-type biogenesis protein CcmH [Aliidongia dinghuensis]